MAKNSTHFYSVILNGEMLGTNFGRDVVFSADLCYNGTNEKPSPLGEVAAKPAERVKWSQHH